MERDIIALRSMIRIIVKEAFINRADPRMSGGRVEAEMTAKKKDPHIVRLQSDARFIRSQIKKAKTGKLRGQNVSLMQDELDRIEAELTSLKVKAD